MLEIFMYIIAISLSVVGYTLGRKFNPDANAADALHLCLAATLGGTIACIGVRIIGHYYGW